MHLDGFYLKANKLKAAPLIIAVISVVISIFFQFPNLTFLKEQTTGKKVYMWHAVQLQAEHPFAKVEHKEGSHEEKKIFRLTLPIIAYTLGLNSVLKLYLFQALLGFLSLWMVARIIKQLTEDNTIAALFTIGISCIYFGSSAFIDVFGFTDSIAYFFLLLAILTRNPALVALSVFAASWADERGLIASSFVFLWFSLIDKEKHSKFTEVISLNKNSMAVVISWVAYFTTRFTYTFIQDIETRTGGIERAFIESVDKIQLSLWSGYESFWLLIAIFALTAIIKKDYWLLFIVTGGYLIITLVALNVFDTTKSMSYGSIGLFVLMAYLSKQIELNDLRKYIAAIAFISIISPTIFVINTIMYTSTFYQEVIRSLIVRSL